MSYAGPADRSRTSASATRPGQAAKRGPRSPQPPRGAPLDDAGHGWQHLALFGAGLALGIAVGAGAALLAAPQTGAETRAALAATVSRTRRNTTRRTRDAWDDLRDEIRAARRMLRRRKTIDVDDEV